MSCRGKVWECWGTEPRGCSISKSVERVARWTRSSSFQFFAERCAVFEARIVIECTVAQRRVDLFWAHVGMWVIHLVDKVVQIGENTLSCNDLNQMFAEILQCFRAVFPWAPWHTSKWCLTVRDRTSAVLHTKSSRIHLYAQYEQFVILHIQRVCCRSVPSSFRWKVDFFVFFRSWGHVKGRLFRSLHWCSLDPSTYVPNHWSSWLNSFADREKGFGSDSKLQFQLLFRKRYSSTVKEVSSFQQHTNTLILIFGYDGFQRL